VFPDRYPPKDFQNYGAQMDSPQTKVLNQIKRAGSAVVAEGIASRDVAETLANKLATFKPDDPYLPPIGSKHVEVVESGLDEAQGVAEGRRRYPPDPQNYYSDQDYYDDLEAYNRSFEDTDDWYDDPETDDDAWMGETKEKVGNMDADAFDDAISRLKKLAGAGPLKTVYDPARRVYRNVPHAVQPAQQPKKAR
jgi:hypothetical protein